MSYRPFAAAAAALLAFACPAAAEEAEQVEPAFRAVLPNVEGKSLIAVVVHYAPGGVSPSHRHPPSAFVFAYVLSGAVASSVDGAPTQVFRAGESWSERPGAHHTVSRNASDTEPASLLAVFIVDSDAKALTIPDPAPAG